MTEFRTRALSLGKKLLWPAIGCLALVISVWLLWHEIRGISLEDLGESLAAIGPGQWFLSLLATLGAYAALSAYDHLALAHLRRHVSWPFVSAVSATTYAISHSLGASALTGAVVRYRAYSSKGLSGTEVGLLVTFCSITFVLGTVLLMGLVLVFSADLDARFAGLLPLEASRVLGGILIGLVVLYVIGSALKLRPLRIGKVSVEYPSLSIALRQVAVAPIEIIFAAAIIYFALPAESNPGFVVVLAVFLASFSAALISHAPGGLGVLELIFVTALPEVRPEDVLAALVVFRVLYLIIPFLIALALVFAFERTQFLKERALGH
ncbi:MAG: hypothetical protein DI556_12540 [Rhodovulum sulfidophilum]|uniref:Uncharacterized protein n=1 Tax=Rhodovulum sulfidophilum TaxID=35806 RepID=A0A2W5N9V0_RHOSU|nr:MAG: hypothetical protein DI556_12540 [Rhodovulum sulfidophilum]